MVDTRVSCFDCRDLGRCSAPIRAHPDILRRCEAFAPKRDAADQRTGAQRYPEFIAERDAVADNEQRVKQDHARRGIERAKAALATA